MTDWSKLFEARDWDALDNWFRHTDDAEARRAFFHRLKAEMPQREVRNGMEVNKEFMTEREAPPEWKGAAHILQLGELEAMVEGEPASEATLWQEVAERIRENLQELASQQEVTSGDPQLSRQAHANRALEAIKDIDATQRFYLSQSDTDEIEWLGEFAASIALLALRAGVFAQAANGKEIEAHAVRGHKVITAASDGGASRVGKFAPDTADRLKTMGHYIDAGHSVSRAAGLTASQHGLGTQAANKKLWGRRKK